MSLSSAFRREGNASSDLSEAVRPATIRYGTPGDDYLKGGGDFDMSQGGDDRLRLDGTPNTVYFGAAFTGADRVNGGRANDTVVLDGDYSAGLEVQATSLTHIEKLVLEGGPYVITGELNFQDTLGRTFVDASSLVAGQSFHLSVQSLGDLLVFGGGGDDVMDESDRVADGPSFLAGFEGDDVLIGGAGEYHLQGNLGADRLISNSNQTLIEYFNQLESTRKNFDTIERFQGKLRFTFDSDTSTPERDHDFHLGKTADHAGDIRFKYDAGADETIVKVFTDHDKVADFVLHLTGEVHLTTADFIFG